MAKTATRHFDQQNDDEMAAEALQSVKSIAESLRRAFPPADEKPFSNWTRRDELAWELFRDDLRGYPLDPNPPEAEEELIKRTDTAYVMADAFLARKRVQ